MKTIMMVTRQDEQSELSQLVAEACSHPPHSIQRQKSLTKIVRAVMKSGKLWQENVPFYADALQQTWLYFYRNLCEVNTGQKYDPDRGSVTTWLNAYLRRRLQDFYIESQVQSEMTVFPRILESGEML